MAEDARLQRRSFGWDAQQGKPRSISKRHRRLLRSFVDPVYARLKAMSDAELWEFIEAGLSVSQTNCGWGEYEVCRTYLESAQALMRERLRAAADAPDERTPA